MDPLQANEMRTPEKFFCAICGKYYDKVFQDVHMQMHNGEEKFNCGICNKVFPNEESINMHMNAHQDTRVVSCQPDVICFKNFLFIYLILQSLLIRPFDNLQIKTKAEMSNIKLPYGCQYCGKEFARPHEKVKHERVHTGMTSISSRYYSLWINSRIMKQLIFFHIFFSCNNFR